MKVSRLITSTTGLAAALMLLPACDRQSGTESVGGASDSAAQSSGQGANEPRARSLDRETNGSDAYAPDNTGRNARDRSTGALTPGDQGTSEADRELTRQIRRAIEGNDQLSTTAKNIKIIAQNGKVTLRGPVDNAKEKDLIESAARQAGASAVDDQLEPKTTNQ
ncbi:MAG TPA: BON domain-containing protein [Verrucomicrobiae bacterium]|nr:BON domain-containing protein [Verrucomicrobiae bacterium]